jgi:UbiD family decarboxylase
MGKGFKDIREHLAALEQAGKLVKIDRAINKDTELMPLVRWQFRGLPESQRKAFLFTNVVDVTGRKYDMPVAVGCLAASREIYALGLGCSVEQISQKWMESEKNPIEPRLIDSGPVQEVVHVGEDLLSHEGLGEFPLPISTPGFDNGPYTTSSHWFTQDPDTGILNIGNYRGQIKSPLRMGIALSSRNHGGIHWSKCRAKGIPLQAALVVGAPPAVAYTAPARVP